MSLDRHSEVCSRHVTGFSHGTKAAISFGDVAEGTGMAR